MHGKDLNAIYDGYSFLPFYLGHTYASSFQHYLDFEPAPKNHMVPHYGIFSRFYFGRLMKSSVGSAEKYSSFKKTSGPPYYHFNPRFGPVEHDPFLARRGIPAGSTRLYEPKVKFHDTDPHHGHSAAH